MKEIKVTKASSSLTERNQLAFTGERYVPTEHGEIRLEHFHRYSIALNIVTDKVVLDIASGEGYGSNLLASVARTVTGVDISKDAVRHARKAYGNKKNLKFLQGSASKIDWPDQTFDVVVSFETIEHLAEQSKMLSEIRRVLKPNGVLLISSPNKPVYSEASGNHNEFHIKELDFKEFDSLLKKQFKAIQYYGQRLMLGSVIQTLTNDTATFRALHDDGTHVQQTAGEMIDPVYFLALCAAKEEIIPSIDASILQPNKLDLLKQYIGYATWAINSNKELDSARKLYTDLDEEHHKVATWAQSLNQQVSTFTQTVAEQKNEIALLTEETVKRGEWAINSNNELDKARKLYTELDEEHHKVATWAQSLNQQVLTFTQTVSEQKNEIALLTEETVKRGEWALGLDAQLRATQTDLTQLNAERDNYIARLTQVDSELSEAQKLYVQLDTEHHKIAAWAQSLDQQVSAYTKTVAEQKNEIALLTEETVKRGEWALGLEQQLNSAKVALTHEISVRDKQILDLNESLAELNYQITNLKLEVLKTESDLKLQNQVYLKNQVEKDLLFEKEKTNLLAMYSESEKNLFKENAAQERLLHERLLSAQSEFTQASQAWLKERVDIENLAASDKAHLLTSYSEKEQALIQESAERERLLHERLLSAQSEFTQASQAWLKERAVIESLAANDKANLVDAYSKKEQVLTQESAERERLLHERLLSAQSEFTQASQAWLKERVDIENLAANDKAHLLTSYSEKEQALIQESAEQLQSALNEIKLAKQLSEHWVVAHDASQMELSAIKSSMTWRLAALLAKLTRRNNFNKLNEVTIFKLNQASNFASTNNLMNSQNITNKYFEEVNMNSNTQPDTNQRITPMGSLIELLGYNDEAFIRAAYNTFLRRAPDAEGMSYYLNKLRSGSDKLEVLDQIVRSKEAKQHAVKLSGLNGAANQKKWLKIPFIGSMLRKRDVNKNLNIIENQLFRLNESIVNRFNQLEKTQQSLVQQVQTSSAANMIQQFVGDHAGSWKNAEKLLYCDEKTFLAILFNLGLQRGPEIHENKHFLDLLTAGANRLQIIESIFTCVESKSLYAQKQNANQPVVAAVALKATNNNNPEDLASVVILDTVTTEVVANENLEQVASLALPIDLTDGTSEQSLPFVTPPNITPEIVAYSGPVQIASVSAESINFFAHEKPLVSVIIPVYGKIEYTLMCLKSIQENLPEVDFEIILVDDKSPDNTAIELAKVRGIKLISNAENLGFIRSCNYGASQASGQYLCFLNNDTEVKTGWLDELVRTFYEFPNTGLVGSKFIYPDGSLQEAGGIIWQDGSAWNFGRNQDSALPIYNYAREVDYCSGASIMIPSSLFNGLGGFDEHYLPAYCEDSDLALKIRDRGYRVIYQPLSVVTHYEGITSGTDTSQGTKAYQIENSKKLFARWESHLKLHQLGGVDVDKAKDRKAKRRVLILDHCTPTPNQDAGSVTVFNLMLLLREMEFQVTFIPEDNFLYMPEYTTALQRVGVEVLYAPYYTSVEQHLAESGSRYDLAFIFRPSVIDRHLNTVRKFCTNAKVLYHTVDLHFLRMMREAELLKDPAKLKAANEMKKLELKAIRSADATIVHSPTELEILRQDLPKDKIYTFPLIMDVCRTDKPFQERSNIVFVGGYQHTPNIDAVQYFVNKVMPLLRRKLPKVRFYAVGSKAPQEILDLACDDVIITGFIDDLNPLLNDMRISVAPLRYGAGIKGKIGTAMVTGLPTVATTLAVEGMNLTDGENILVADGEKAFAAAIIKIYNDEALWNKVSKDGIAFAENAWGAGTAYNTLELILADLNLAPSKINSSLNSYAPFKINTLKTKLSLSNSPHITESLSVTESTSVTENKEYRAKIEQELAIYEKQEKVHDLPEIFHYWSNKFLFPIVKNAGFTSVNNFFSSTLYESWKKTNIVRPYFLSIGAGNCDLEIDLAKELLEFGCNDFIFECLELNPVMLERAFANAEKSGVQNHMKFTQTDFNTWIPTREYFGVIANQSLHHVTELEHLFGQVKKCMHKKGVFVISDIIGRNGHQRWPESLKLVHQFWEELPKPFKFNLILNRHEPVYENWDCSKEGFEGIRAQDILPLLLKDFKCDKFIGFGSVIDIFVDRAFGHHFNPNNVKDLEFIDRIHEADELGLQSGELTPTHMMAVFKKTSSLNPYISRDVTPEKSVRIE